MTILLMPAISAGYTAVSYMAPIALGYCVGSKVKRVVESKMALSDNACFKCLRAIAGKAKLPPKKITTGSGIIAGGAVALCFGTPAWLLVATAMTVAYMKYRQ